jgi:hypothetical protein
MHEVVHQCPKEWLQSLFRVEKRLHMLGFGGRLLLGSSGGTGRITWCYKWPTPAFPTLAAIIRTLRKFLSGFSPTDSA